MSVIVLGNLGFSKTPGRLVKVLPWFYDQQTPKSFMNLRLIIVKLELYFQQIIVVIDLIIMLLFIIYFIALKMWGK